jgi:uncharacterized membrane protein
MVKEIVISAITMLCLDFVYLSANRVPFENMIASIQRVVMKIRLESAVLCYLFLIFGLYYFILRNRGSVLDAFLFGLVIYGVYETTNYAMIKKWSPYLAVMDTLWGGVLMALTTMITYAIARRF